MIKATLSVAATLAAASVAASSSLSTSSPFPVTTGPDIQKLAPWNSKPIRTVVTVNSNRIDVLAAAEEDVPKVLEKLRELCAGPYASKYPEICEHLKDDDLWWSAAAPSVTSSILSYISTLESLSASAIPTEPTPSLATPSSSPVAESRITILPSASPAPAESIASPATATTLVTSVAPTTISLAPSTTTASPSTLELTVTQSIYRSHLTAHIQETVECPYSTADGGDGETKPLCTVITIYHHLLIPTLITVTGPILSFPRNAPAGITLEPPQPNLPSRTRIRTTVVKTIEVVTDVPFDDSAAADDDSAPSDDDDDDDGPPVSVQFIRPSPIIQPPLPIINTIEAIITAPADELEPTFAPARPAWSGYEPYPSVSWFMSADPPGGCTQTESIFRKITDFQTATVYAETVRTTRVIGCGCPNIMVVSVGGPGVVIEAVTTVTVEGKVWTETGFACFTAFDGVGV